MKTMSPGAWLRKCADHRQLDSVASRLRSRRNALFCSLLNRLPRPVRVLDIGGEEGFWDPARMACGDGIEVTLLNLRFEPGASSRFQKVKADACHLPFPSSHPFDVVYSNSVIEHMGCLDNQKRMAAEILRVGKRYFIQTPSLWFPMEPHFLFPAFQFLPLTLRYWIASHYSGGWYCRPGDAVAAGREVDSIRLMMRRECGRLFPGARIFTERFFGFTKSYLIIGGPWAPDRNRSS